MRTITILDKENNKVLIMPYLEKIGTPDDFIQKLVDNEELNSTESCVWHLFEEVKIVNLLPK